MTLLPRLQRFYGGTIGEWLSVPVAFVRAYAGAMPKIQAEEALLKTSIVALGSGRMKKSDADQTLRAWRRTAGTAKTRSAKSKDEMASVLGGVGIAFVEVPAHG
jgi:hypothetical protein